MPTAVFDETRFLKLIGHKRYAGPTHANHLRHEFLRKLELIAHEVRYTRQPSANATFHRVGSIAADRLLNLRKKKLFMLGEQRAQRLMCLDQSFQFIDGNNRGLAWRLNQYFVGRNFAIESLDSTHNAIPPDH